MVHRMDLVLFHRWTSSVDMPHSKHGRVNNGPTYCKSGCTSLKLVWSSSNTTSYIRYFVDPECIVIRGKPSADMAERLETSEKARIADQVKKLGPEGLTRVTKELEDAKAEHDKPIPKEVLTAFPVPDVRSIAWIPVQSVQERGTGRTSPKHVADSELKRHIESDGSPLPFFVEYEHVKVWRFKFRVIIYVRISGSSFD